ncbi:cobalamin-dependent protein [Marispirochaeta aestuarii]|uniref:cobalamin-dependent protein n=1 Tax=Marispirochaeta aestuarii TaxID=1963862 RepID=UPI0029C83FCB|nr:cobalamin-dependent protein [Marispirochaeta aestuarii]
MDESPAENNFRTYIDEHELALSDQIITLLWRDHPEYDRIFDETGKGKCAQDIRYHLKYLADAVDAESPALFLRYLEWVKSLFASLNIPRDTFSETLKAMKEVLKKQSSIALNYLDEGLKAYPKLPDRHDSFISPENPLSGVAGNYIQALLKRDREGAMKIIMQEMEAGRDIREMYEYVFQVSQREIGRLWQTGNVSVAQEHYCTGATQLIMSRLYPYVFNHEKNGLTFIGTSVGDELHELGIRMVSDFFELDGWDTIFLGANTPAKDILRCIMDEQAKVIGISVTITFHLHKAREIIDSIAENPELRGVRILVGGYPFNEDRELWHRIGAHGYGTDARDAIRTARRLVGI